MTHHTFSRIVCQLLAAVVTILGLGTCKCHKNAVDNNDKKETPTIDPREDIGRAVALYGGPNMRFQQPVKAPEEPSSTEK
ncbi:MAG: hypothetical protein J6I60_02695 [Bacteroidaceae bacterium]|nr:hypothetical protein [Bacteroidaceae bacterium]